MLGFALLVLLGAVVGGFGTLIGAGGGFILLPILLFLFPHERADVLTGISLTVVCANAASGSVAYARQGRIDFRSGVVFALAGLPGAFLGSLVTSRLDRARFDPLLGGFLLLGALLLLVHPRRDDPASAPRRSRLVLGAALSVFVGFLSSLLGIGGGILHVPAMVYLLGFPVHVATATSHFVLAVLALAGVLAHLADGTLAPGLARAVPLALGVLVGAQVGAKFSSRVSGPWILRALAAALILVGFRLLVLG